MMFRCLNNCWGYCRKQFEVEEEDRGREGVWFPVRATCKLDPKTCGEYQTLSQQLEGKPLPKPKYKRVGRGRFVGVEDD